VTIINSRECFFRVAVIYFYIVKLKTIHSLVSNVNRPNPCVPQLYESDQTFEQYVYAGTEPITLTVLLILFFHYLIE